MNFMQTSRISGRRWLIFAAPRCVRSSQTWARPSSRWTPRPSRISVIMERETMSRGASSIMDGAYRSMNRSPSALRR